MGRCDGRIKSEQAAGCWAADCIETPSKQVTRFVVVVVGCAQVPLGELRRRDGGRSVVILRRVLRLRETTSACFIMGNCLKRSSGALQDNTTLLINAADPATSSGSSHIFSSPLPYNVNIALFFSLHHHSLASFLFFRPLF